MYKADPKRSAPVVLETLAEKIRTADAFVLVTGEYNWGVQPAPKNLTDHILEAWFGRPGAISSDSASRPVMAARRWSRPFPGCADDLGWWTKAARLQRAKVVPPY